MQIDTDFVYPMTYRPSELPLTLDGLRTCKKLSDDGQKLTVTSNGTPVSGNPKDLRLQPDQQIVLELP